MSNPDYKNWKQERTLLTGTFTELSANSKSFWLSSTTAIILKRRRIKMTPIQTFYVTFVAQLFSASPTAIGLFPHFSLQMWHNTC